MFEQILTKSIREVEQKKYQRSRTKKYQRSKTTNNELLTCSAAEPPLQTIGSSARVLSKEFLLYKQLLQKKIKQIGFDQFFFQQRFLFEIFQLS